MFVLSVTNYRLCHGNFVCFGCLVLCYHFLACFYKTFYLGSSWRKTSSDIIYKYPIRYVSNDVTWSGVRGTSVFTSGYLFFSSTMAWYRVLYVAHTTSTARLWTVSLQRNIENEGYPIFCLNIPACNLVLYQLKGEYYGYSLWANYS